MARALLMPALAGMIRLCCYKDWLTHLAKDAASEYTQPLSAGFNNTETKYVTQGSNTITEPVGKSGV